MNSIDLLIMNFEEVRRRSIKVWSAIPVEHMDWKPDENAMSILEMIRHVLESEYYYHLMIVNRGSLKEYSPSPFEDRQFETIAEEINFAGPYRSGFLQMVSSFNESDLTEISIDRSDVGYTRTLGDMLLRVAYHESVHTGQILQYLRMIDADRANIWD
jgi:uncharacterized damage-inducible protein DinB